MRASDDVTIALIVLVVAGLLVAGGYIISLRRSHQLGWFAGIAILLLVAAGLLSLAYTWAIPGPESDPTEEARDWILLSS